MHDESNSSEGSKQSEVRRDGKTVTVSTCDESTNWAEFHYSLDGDLIAGPTPADNGARNGE